jgi:GDP-L-fucose synthase
MDTTSRIFVADHKSTIGAAITRLLYKENYTNLLLPGENQLNLKNKTEVDEFFKVNKPEYVVMSEGRSAGIVENRRIPADFLYENLCTSLNILHAAHVHGVSKTIFMGSSCMYPKHCTQPMNEDMLLTGKPEETSMGTAMAKLAGMQLCLSYNLQYGYTRFIPVIPNNTYGQNDNFNPATGHVLCVMIHRFHAAKVLGARVVELWGSGNARREFIHTDDIAGACLILMNTKLEATDLPINIGVGEDYSIRELSVIIADIVGYKGAVTWNTKMPEGTPRKLLDSTRIRSLGWSPAIKLEEGIQNTYRWYLENINDTGAIKPIPQTGAIHESF